MSKIVVYTLSNAVDNYGQVLQYLATQFFLEKRGHSVFLLTEDPETYPLWRTVASKIKGLLLRRKSTYYQTGISEEDRAKLQIFRGWSLSIERNEKLHPRRFDDFKKKYFKFVHSTYSKLSFLKFDAYVVGSDQTWTWVDYKNFLGWAPATAKKISIAPSVGHKYFSDLDIKRARPLLERFDFVTVREDNGLDFCHKAGRNDAIKILDPTFLMSEKDYGHYEKPHGIDRPYILLYLLGGEIDVEVSEIYEFAKKEGLYVVYVASQGREDDYPKYYAEVGQWLSLVRDAKYIFTNSFHGMAFSIIYHKRFLVFPLVGLMSGMNGRIENLAHTFNLRGNIYSGSLSSVVSEVDYDCVVHVIIKNKELLVNKLKDIQL